MTAKCPPHTLHRNCVLSQSPTPPRTLSFGWLLLFLLIGSHVRPGPSPSIYFSMGCLFGIPGDPQHKIEPTKRTRRHHKYCEQVHCAGKAGRLPRVAAEVVADVAPDWQNCALKGNNKKGMQLTHQRKVKKTECARRCP